MAETELNEQTEAATEVNDVEMTEMDPNEVPADEQSLDRLLNINMPITVTIGHTEIPFKDLLQLGPSAVLPLDKPIGEPAELYVQDIQFATGDIVVVDGYFAIRIKEISGMDAAEKAIQQQQEQQQQTQE